MSKKTAIVSVLCVLMAICFAVTVILGTGLLHATSAAMSTGEPVSASSGTWFTMIASLLGIPVTGGAAALVAWLMKAGGSVVPGLKQIDLSAGGQHQMVLGAILSALQVASGQPAQSEGKATLGGGTLAWSFTFTPTEGAK